MLTQTFVLDTWDLIPSGLSVGDSFRLLFLSSTTRNASSSSIGTYNTFVQNRADAGHSGLANYASQFKVVGSTADTDARDNTETTGTGVPIYWVNGNKLADGYSDFYDGSWDDETNIKDESGENRSSPLLIFTGSDNDGTESFVASSSRAFGMNNVRMGQLGATGTVNSPLSGNFVAGKNENYPFYGLSPVFTIATPVLNDTWSLKPSGLGVGDGFRLIFLSSTKRNASSSSIGTYNTWIQARAAAGHDDIQAYSDGFTVVGCTEPSMPETTPAPPTAPTEGVPIYWLNGNKVADDYEDFYDETRGTTRRTTRTSWENGPNTSTVKQLPFTGCDHDGTEKISDHRLATQSKALGNHLRAHCPTQLLRRGHGPLSSAPMTRTEAAPAPCTGSPTSSPSWTRSPRSRWSATPGRRRPTLPLRYSRSPSRRAATWAATR